MRKDIQKRTLGSALFARLEAVPMRHAEREKTLRAFYDAQLSIDALTWLARKVERLVGRWFLKPAL